MSEDVTPSRQLAERAVDLLIAAKLVRAEKRASILMKVATGDMKASDWKLELDIAEAKAVKP
jgi:hypothetical protein